MSREIVKLSGADIGQIMQIERTSFSLAWEKEAFLQELEENVCARYIGLKEDGQLLGYAGMWLGFDGEAHVTNVAVRTDMRRQGIGVELMLELMQLAANCGMAWMSLECRRSNSAAQSLYHKLGFVDVGYRKRYYPDNSEDALVMCRLSLPEGDPDADEDIVEE